MHLNLSRFQAFAIHLLISSAVLGSFLAFVFLVWYPHPFFILEGLVQIVWVLVGVDIVLGPALTLVVFKTGKPGLKRDLSIIAAIQIFGFIYGAHTFYIERPAFAVFYDSDHFEVIPASDMEDLAKLDPALWSHRAFLMLMGLAFEKLSTNAHELSTDEIVKLTKALGDACRVVPRTKTEKTARESGKNETDPLPKNFAEIVRQVYGTNFSETVEKKS